MRMWRNQGFHILLAVMSNGAVTLKKADLQTELLRDAAVLIPGIHPREMRTYTLT